MDWYKTRADQQNASDLDFVYNHEVGDSFSFILKSLNLEDLIYIPLNS